MKKLLIALAISATFVVSAFAKDVVYVTNFGEDNVATGSDGTKTAITIKAEAIKVVKIYGGLKQGQTSTSFDLNLYSDNVSGTEQEDILYNINNVTTGYYVDDIPVYLTASGTTSKTIYYKIHNDGNESDFDFWMIYKPFVKK